MLITVCRIEDIQANLRRGTDAAAQKLQEAQQELEEQRRSFQVASQPDCFRWDLSSPIGRRMLQSAMTQPWLA